jgi:uncharacterized YccA/Bax inhibitor family protein
MANRSLADPVMVAVPDTLRDTGGDRPPGLVTVSRGALDVRRGFDSRSFLRTSNPALREDAFRGMIAGPRGRVMTVQGTVNKTAVLLVLLLASAAWTWSATTPETARPWVFGAAILGLLIALPTVFMPRIAPYTAPAYALVEGVFLGGISELFNQFYPGLVLQAVGATLGVLAAMLLIYTSRLIRVTSKFRMGVAAATLGIFLFYTVSLVLSLFGVNVPVVNDASLLGILISVAIVIVAALNLVLDFDFIERGAANGAPRSTEWYAGFSLLVTLVWLYLEILRLLSRLRD